MWLNLLVYLQLGRYPTTAVYINLPLYCVSKFTLHSHRIKVKTTTHLFGHFICIIYDCKVVITLRGIIGRFKPPEPAHAKASMWKHK